MILLANLKQLVWEAGDIIFLNQNLLSLKKEIVLCNIRIIISKVKISFYKKKYFFVFLCSSLKTKMHPLSLLTSRVFFISCKNNKFIQKIDYQFIYIFLFVCECYFFFNLTSLMPFYYHV